MIGFEMDQTSELHVPISISLTPIHFVLYISIIFIVVWYTIVPQLPILIMYVKLANNNNVRALL